MRRSTRTAFTLIELLVVIAIIALLLCWVLPAARVLRARGDAGPAPAVVAASQIQLQHFTVADAAERPPEFYFPRGNANWFLLNSQGREVRSDVAGIVRADAQPPEWATEIDLTVKVFLEVDGRIILAQSGVRIAERSTIILDRTIPQILDGIAVPVSGPATRPSWLMNPWAIAIGGAVAAGIVLELVVVRRWRRERRQPGAPA